MRIYLDCIPCFTRWLAVVDDPYYGVKRRFNNAVLKLYSQMRIKINANKSSGRRIVHPSWFFTVKDKV